MSGHKALCRGPALSVSGSNALCRGPALSVSGPGAALCLAPALSAVSVSGSGRLCGACVGPQRSVCRGPPLSVSGPGALCRGLCRGPPILINAVCVGPRRSLCRGPALFVSGPGALCVGACRSVLAPALLGPEPSALCRGPALVGPAVFSADFLSGPGALSLSQPGALCVGTRGSVCGPAVLVSGQARRSLRRCPALIVALSVTSRRRGSAVLCQDSVCQVPAVCVSGPVKARQSSPTALFLAALCVGQALFVSGPRRTSSPKTLVRSRRSVCRVGGLGRLSVEDQRSVWRGDRRSFCRPGWPRRSLCRARRSCYRAQKRGQSVCWARQLRSARATRWGTPSRAPPVPRIWPDLRATHPALRPRLESACPSSPERSLFPGENPKPYCLGEKSNDEAFHFVIGDHFP